ncbi:hypothetical protein [Bacillus thuringiensis]|uniref:hypothetical protein n=1 Tax=Bacillus thuringiensis TaxID=1428 RepID=UPI0016429520|nr:hypothetical protein [Bacillus thuringiensis]
MVASVIVSEDTGKEQKKTKKAADTRMKNIETLQSDSTVNNYTNQLVHIEKERNYGCER